MRLSPKECMIVEDNENGIKAARASGANVMIVDSVNYRTFWKRKLMINILAGKNQFFSEYPKPLIEFNGKTIIDNFSTIQKEKQFIVNSEDCKKYHLDILTNQTW